MIPCLSKVSIVVKSAACFEEELYYEQLSIRHPLRLDEIQVF